MEEVGYTWVYVVSYGTGSLVLIDDVTEDQSNLMKFEVHKNTLFPQVQPNAAKLF